jgi:hypothetical protein
MRRPLIALSVPAAVLGCWVAGAFASPRAHLRISQARVVVADCHPADDVAQRYASFSGQMRRVAGAQQMDMRFTLLERLGGRFAHFKPVSLQDLKPWRRSKAGARMFIYTQRVTALRDGGSYRMRVQFRWYDAQGSLLRSTTVSSRSCRQPAPLPNLTISSITSAPPQLASDRIYSVTVSNNGMGDARDVPVELQVDGTTAGRATLDLLPGQESSVVQIEGPRCGFSLRAMADPDRRIAETDETDNALVAPCTQ